MTNLLFTFPSRPAGSYTWPVKITPNFSTLIKTSANGIEVRVQQWPYPKISYDFPLGYLKGNAQNATAYRDLIGFYMAVGGAANSFLWLNPWDNTVTATGTPGSTAGFLALGDGVTRTFQLYRQIGLGQEIVQNPNPSSVSILINGSPLSSASFSVGFSGVVTLTSPPSSGSVVAWQGQFYNRLRFTEDSLSELQLLMSDIWDCSSLKLLSVWTPG